MRRFKLTLKAQDDKELSADFIKKVMKRLYQDFELLDDPDSCNCELSELLTERQIKDLSVFVNGNDAPSVVNVLKRLLLVGSRRGGDFCQSCGHPSYYYTGGRMLCGHCEYSEAAEEYIELGDITDYSGFVAL